MMKTKGMMPVVAIALFVACIGLVRAQQEYFSWDVIAEQYLKVLSQ